MKITKVETIQIETPRYTGQISGHVIVKVYVDDGPVGLGEASDSRADDLGAITRRYNELLVGRDATRITETNEFLRAQDFGSTVTIYTSPQPSTWHSTTSTARYRECPSTKCWAAKCVIASTVVIQLGGCRCGRTSKGPQATCNGW